MLTLTTKVLCIPSRIPLYLLSQSRRTGSEPICCAPATTRKPIMSASLADRKPYRAKDDTFDVSDLSARDPISQFESWFNDACERVDIIEPNAVALASTSKSGTPSLRMVLMKSFSKDGFIFFTNFQSRKGRELDANPRCSLMFYWPPLNRSVRIDGVAEVVSDQLSTIYFQSRPRQSQLAAVVSQQSTVISSRMELMEKFMDLQKKYVDESQSISKPDNWGGYLVRPETVEFWQGQTNRMHDRILFRKKKAGEVIDPKMTMEGDGWLIERLSP